jgi:protoporphyrinogen oxidase
LIIGAGPAGLAVAYALQGDTLVLEKEDEVGGLCRSIKHDGGVFDIGGHSFHTPHPDVAALMNEVTDGGLYLQQRDARVYSMGTLIPYPFQRYYERLPDPAVVRACEEGLREAAASEAGEPEDFEQYIVQRFGRGIAEHFMLPYNRKLWARDISKISCEWTSERVAAPKGGERFDTSGGKRKPLQPDTRVGYPRSGGFEEMFRGLSQHVPRVSTNREVARIDPVAKVAVTTDGDEFSWDYLVTTMPLPELVRVVEGVPEELVRTASGLDYMSLRVELLLAHGPLDTEIQRVYSAEAEIPPHKIAMNHNSSSELRQRSVHAIMAEVSLSEEKPVDTSEIAPRTIDLLCDIGVLDSPDQIAWRGHVDVEYAYPVYTHARPGQVASIKAWLEPFNIYTVGRFGDWEYVNSDKCVHKGLELGAQLAARRPGR